jgi:hypothetical protein
MHFLKRGSVRLAVVALLIGVAAGAAAGVVRRGNPTGAQPPSDGPRSWVFQNWPDRSLDVCVIAREGAALDVDAVEEGMEGLASSPTGTFFGVDLLELNATDECQGHARASVITVDGSPRFDARPDTIEGGDGGPFDLYLYIYPQARADAVGSRWDQPIITHEVRGLAGGGSAETAKGVLIGLQELRDPATRHRILIRGFGLKRGPEETGTTVDGS